MRISVLTEATRARCDPSSRAFGTDHRTGVALLRLLSSMLSSRRTRRAQMHAGRTKITTRSIYYLSIAHVTECPGPDSNRDALRRCPLKAGGMSWHRAASGLIVAHAGRLRVGAVPPVL